MPDPINGHTMERLIEGVHQIPRGPACHPDDPNELVRAYVSHGRWVIRCPFCGSALIPPLRAPRFVCIDCRNVDVDGRARRVAWPADVVAIEAPLLVRPVANRNWHPHETPEDLQIENMLHGYPSEPGALFASPDGLVDRL